jgi:hypothetical protein
MTQRSSFKEWTVREQQRLINYLSKGMTFKEVAARLGRPQGSVAYKAKQLRKLGDLDKCQRQDQLCPACGEDERTEDPWGKLRSYCAVCARVRERKRRSLKSGVALADLHTNFDHSNCAP